MMLSENDPIQSMIISGSGGGKSSTPETRIPVEDPNTLRSKATLKIVEVISEGEIEGLVDGDKSIFLDNTPLQNSDNSYNFAGISSAKRFGTPDQDPIPGFTGSEQEIGVAVKVTTTAPIVRTISDLNTDAIRVTLKVPALTWQNIENGDLRFSWVSYKIELQSNGGGYVTLFDDYIEGKTTSPYEFSYRIDLTSEGPWDVRVSRVREDNIHSHIRNDLYWARYTKIIDDKLIYPDTALIALGIDSSLFGSSIPTRSYEVKGIKIKLPTNYDPITRAYTGIWDGTLTTAWSDNPAWILYDVITNDRYGLGQYIDPDQVDKFSFYEIAQYCDELISDGDGGTEPRYTFNGVIQSQSDAIKIIQSIASNFRGMLYWGSSGSSGIIIPVHDAPKDSVKLFSQANVVDGLFNYSGSSLSARHSAAYVTWNDPDNAYQASVEIVEDQDLILAYGFRKVDVSAYGCTSRSQAYRHGKWVLESEANETEAVQFKVGFADMDVRPGDIIEIYDDSYADLRFGGRIVSATTTQITLDDTITIEGGKSYTITVTLPNGLIGESTITNSAGDYSMINFSPALSDTPLANGMWGITVSDLAPRKFKIITVKEVDEIEYEVSALFHDSAKYTRVESDLNIPPLTYTSLQYGPVAAPTNLTTFEYLYRAGASNKSAVTLSWTPSTDSRVVQYEVEFKEPSDPDLPSTLPSAYKFAARTGVTSVDITDTHDGVWSFRVKALDALGNSSAFLELESQSLTINSIFSANISEFSINPIGNTAVLTWSEVANLNLSHYEIRFTSELATPSWAASSIMVKSVPGGTSTAVVPSRSGTYFIKAVSIPTSTFPNGVYSTSSTSISTTIDSLLNYNFVLSITEDPTFAGSRDGVLISSTSGDLILDISSSYDVDDISDVDAIDNFDNNGFAYNSEGTYTFANSIDLGEVYTTNRVGSILTVAGLNSENNVDTWADFDAIDNVDDVSESDFDVTFQTRTTSDDPAGTPTWSTWQDFQISDYTARAFEFRAKLLSFNPTITPSVSGVGATVDMPDSIRSSEDLVVPVNGDTYLFSQAFRNSNPSLAIAAQDLQQGDYWVITNKLATGFDIEFFDSTDTSVSRTFDYLARGYGYVSV